MGPVNCYLIRRDEPALIDCGPKTPEAFAALTAGLAALGLAPRELRHLVATHSHVDHHGNLARLAAEAPGAWIHVHEADAPLVFEFRESHEARVGLMLELVRFWGIPAAVHPYAEKMYRGFTKYADSLGRDRWHALAGEEAEIAFGTVRARALHAPGHTEGLICLHLAEDGGLLFANDHILERITPNPTVYMPPYRGRRTGLADYIASLGRLRGEAVARVLPGHGPPFGGLAARIDEILAHHEERKRCVLALCAAGERSVIELALEHWPGLAVGQYYLACREMHGHLEVLEEEGKVARRMDGEVAKWRAR